MLSWQQDCVAEPARTERGYENVPALSHASWQEYTSDWQAETFARRVNDDIVAVADLGWGTTGVADNEMPQHLKPRRVHGIDPLTGQRINLPIASNDAAIYSVAGSPPIFTYAGIDYTIIGFTGEKRSLPR